jgi:type I restriction enzyme, S subunit
MEIKQWKTKQLDEVATFYSGGTPSKQEPNYWEGDYPWVSAKDMKSFSINDAELKLTPQGLAVAKIAPKGSVLVLVRGMTLLKDLPVGYVERDVAFNQDIKALVSKAGVSGLFLAYSLIANKNRILNLVNVAGHGTGRLDTNLLKEFSIDFPPLPEQRKIAEILGAWDDAIALLEKLITAKRKLKQGLMQQLLTGKKRFKEFEGSEWDIVRLGDLCSVITKGTTPSSVGFEFCNRGINYVKIESINDRGQFLIEKLAKISQKAHQALKRSQLKESDILFSIAGALGRVAIVENNILPANTNQALAIIRLREEYLNCHKYLFQYLKSELIAKHIERINVQAAQANLSLSQLNDFRIIFPSLLEQEKIASVLSAADAEISNLEKQLAAYKQQKRGLMQQLLTGKTRVRVN